MSNEKEMCEYVESMTHDDLVGVIHGITESPQSAVNTLRELRMRDVRKGAQIERARVIKVAIGNKYEDCETCRMVVDFEEFLDEVAQEETNVK